MKIWLCGSGPNCIAGWKVGEPDWLVLKSGSCLFRGADGMAGKAVSGSLIATTLYSN